MVPGPLFIGCNWSEFQVNQFKGKHIMSYTAEGTIEIDLGEWIRKRED
jgi:hypothetical protein